MSKILPTALAATVLLVSPVAIPRMTLADTCASKCGAHPIQFTPGEAITVEVANLTNSLVELQKVYGTDPIPLTPGQVFRINQGDGTTPNISLVFWDATGLPLRSRISQPNATTLRVEIRLGGRPPGDRSVYIRNDGRVLVF